MRSFTMYQQLEQDYELLKSNYSAQRLAHDNLVIANRRQANEIAILKNVIAN
jgi:hypothetical protein